jgi:restriction system protein
LGKNSFEKSGLLNYPKRGCVQITERGLSILEHKPERIDVKLLKQFDEYNEFIRIPNENKIEEETMQDVENNTPEELMDTAFHSIKKHWQMKFLKK